MSPVRRPETPEALRRGRELAAQIEPSPSLRRGVGSPALFGIVQGVVAASLYFALGLIAERAAGLTWLVILVAALFFTLLVVSYVEGTSLHRERGGATVLTRYAFNELWSFVAGWAILLDYLILFAICAFATTDYAAAFWEPLGEGVPEFCFAAAIVGSVAWLHVRGDEPRRYERAALLVLADLGVQVIVVVVGVVVLFAPEVLSDPASVAGTPSPGDLMLAFTLAIVGFTGLDASSGLAGEVVISRRGLRRLIAVRLPAFLPYLGIAVLASSTLPRAMGGAPVQGHDPIDAPVLGVLAFIETDWLRQALTLLVAASAVLVLVVAANAAMLGLSRLGYSLALNRQIPSLLGRLHPSRATPVVLIGLAAVLAVALLIPADLGFLVGIYAFGATLAFTLVHLSVCVLRWREPTRDRPYKMPFNVVVRGVEVPLPAALGALMSAAAFVTVLAVHEGARVVGSLWLLGGLVLYLAFRTSEDKPVFGRVTVPERALRRSEGPDAEFGSILVPVFGTPLDDDIVQTAGRLAGDEDEDRGEGGAVIEALWVFEMPMALPIDAGVPEAELKRARAALARAKAVGEEYEGVEVATATVRARRAGEAIVHEARRRGVEAIVLAAEAPTRQRGGMLLGGKEGLRDTFVGETTRYVITKAPCRVILTAPPAQRAPAASDAGGASHPPVPVGTEAARAPGAGAPDRAAGAGGADLETPESWDGSYGPVPPGVPPPPRGTRRAKLRQLVGLGGNGRGADEGR